ncbi:MAG TPA: CehA/McbA family metallohydrolase [Bryobacteraceae bacterium]|nr:CehA/McbA family metallohydrolase [Bryobacteraceae bacterium]
MGHVHLSRREILKSIPVLGRGSLLIPAGNLIAQRPDTSAPGVIRGSLVDDATGQPTAAKIRVVNTNTGEAYLPPTAIKTMPKRTYFYARGSYEIAVPPGRYQIEVVRGISHKAVIDFTEVGSAITHVHDFRIPVLKDLRTSGWYSGNTHTHYALEIDEDPDDRLRMVPPAEGLDVSVISYLIRTDSPYITNRYPVGRLPQFSKDGTIMDMGEEARNNRTFGGFGYGHVLFLNIPRAIEPVSTGLLAKGKNVPDFPTLSMLCAEARRIGGTTVWCHNGSGIEAPVAAALGQMDAYNLADGLEANYDRYYRLLNCGLRMPASSGTDWWIYDHNRVFVQVAGSFTYDSWIAGLRAGRTFVSNGPLLELSVNGQAPGATLKTSGLLRISASAISRLPFERIQILYNGDVIAEQAARKDSEAKLEQEVEVDRGGWIAARVSGGAKTHAGFTVFAHTSPVYVEVDGTPHRRAEAAGAFVDEIEESVQSIRKHYSFAKDADRALAIGRFEEGRAVFAKIASAK